MYWMLMVLPLMASSNIGKRTMSKDSKLDVVLLDQLKNLALLICLGILGHEQVIEFDVTAPGQGLDSGWFKLMTGTLIRRGPVLSPNSRSLRQQSILDTMMSLLDEGPDLGVDLGGEYKVFCWWAKIRSILVNNGLGPRACMSATVHLRKYSKLPAGHLSAIHGLPGTVTASLHEPLLQADQALSRAAKLSSSERNSV